MKQSELLFKIGSELPLELIINIYSYCEKAEHTSLLKIIFIKFHEPFKKFLRFFICFIFIGYVISFWSWIIFNQNHKN